MITVKCARPLLEKVPAKKRIVPGKEYSVTEIVYTIGSNGYWGSFFRLTENIDTLYGSGHFILTQELNNLTAYSYSPLHPELRKN